MLVLPMGEVKFYTIWRIRWASTFSHEMTVLWQEGYVSGDRGVIYWVNLRKPHGEVVASVFRDSLERDNPSFAGRKCRLCGWMCLTFHRPYQDPRKPFTMADDVVEHPVAVGVLEYHVMLMLIISHMPQV